MINENRPPYEFLGDIGSELPEQYHIPPHPLVPDAMLTIQERAMPIEQRIHGRAPTLQEVHEGTFEEFQELDEAKFAYEQNPSYGNLQELQSEVVDVIIRLATYGGLIGVNWVDKVNEKMDVMDAKYSQAKIEQARSQGLSTSAVVYECRKAWGNP